jgi:TatD family-associated radical SAM protein
VNRSQAASHGEAGVKTSGLAPSEDDGHMPSSIVYEHKNALYVNITNRCSNRCVFCLRSQSNGIRSDLNLWLESEPTVDEVIDALQSNAIHERSEVVFCGYGEPTIRIDDVLAICERLKLMSKARLRIDTNGQGSLINKRDITQGFSGLVDAVSISMNASNGEEYQRLCRSALGDRAFEAVLEFAEQCLRCVPEVVLSVVDVIGDDEIQACRAIAQDMGAQFRVRPFTILSSKPRGKG